MYRQALLNAMAIDLGMDDHFLAIDQATCHMQGTDHKCQSDSCA